MKREIRRRNHIAKDLRTVKYHQRRIPTEEEEFDMDEALSEYYEFNGDIEDDESNYEDED